MRNEVVNRIFEIIGIPGDQNFCIQRWFCVAEFVNAIVKKFDKLTWKSVRYFHITDLDLQSLTDQQLTELFELVIRRQYTQM